MGGVVRRGYIPNRQWSEGRFSTRPRRSSLRGYPARENTCGREVPERYRRRPTNAQHPLPGPAGGHRAATLSSFSLTAPLVRGRRTAHHRGTLPRSGASRRGHAESLRDRDGDRLLDATARYQAIGPVRRSYGDRCRLRRLAGWAIAEYVRTEIVEDTPKAADALRGGLAGAIYHSDHGSQCTSKDFAQRHDELGPPIRWARSLRVRTMR